MRSRLLRILFGLALTAFTPASVVAHHSLAGFDLDTELVMQGTVTRFDYLHPHVHLLVAVINDDGSATEWDFELDAPVQLEALGVGADFFQPGESIKLRTNPARDGSRVGFLAGAVTLSGKHFRDTYGLDD
jgi:hypothetical protein